MVFWLACLYDFTFAADAPDGGCRRAVSVLAVLWWSDGQEVVKLCLNLRCGKAALILHLEGLGRLRGGIE